MTLTNDSIRDSVWLFVWGSVNYSTCNSLGDSVRISVWNSAWNSVYKSTKNSANQKLQEYEFNK